LLLLWPGPLVSGDIESEIYELDQNFEADKRGTLATGYEERAYGW
jgi:hypothetical protein